MTIKPDWIMGGDPIRLHWCGNQADWHPDDLRWAPLSEWRTPNGEFLLEAGKDKHGTPAAVRIVGDIHGTSRELTGELGWLIPQDRTTVDLPFIEPDLWSKEWGDYCHGKLKATDLVERICAQPPRLRAFFPIVAGRKDRGIAIPMLTFAGGVGAGIAAVFVLSPFFKADDNPTMPGTPPDAHEQTQPTGSGNTELETPGNSSRPDSPPPSSQ